MADPRQRIETWFEDFARLIYRRRLVTLALMAVLVGGLASGLRFIVVDTSVESFLHQDDPILETYYEFRDQFGRDDIIIIAVEPRQLFDQETLAKLAALHEELEDGVPHLNDITSMVNARYTRGEADRLVVGELLEDRPQTAEEMASLRERVLANPLYVNQLISEDGRLTTIVIEIDAYAGPEMEVDEILAGFDDDGADVAGEAAGGRHLLTDDEYRLVAQTTEDIVARYRSDDFMIYVAGMPMVTDALKAALMKDMGLFMRLALLAIALCLFAMFRRVTGVLLPLLVVVLSLLGTVGAMGLAGVSIKLPTIILPSFILAVGVGASVHVLSIFYQNLERSGDKEAAIVGALGHSGLAIVMTSLTTAAGLGSFSTAQVAPVADLGKFASLGVMLSLVFTVVLLPALLSMVPVKPKRRLGEKPRGSLFDRFLDAATDFSTGHPKAILAGCAIMVAVSLGGAQRLYFSHDILSWMPADWKVHQATRKIDEKLRGTVSLEIILDTGRENGLYDPAVLKELDRLAREIEGERWGDLFVGKATSVADILKEIHQALNENRPEFHVIPDNAKLIPQEFLLFENTGSDDLENVIDTRFQVARFSARVPWRDVYLYAPFMLDIENRFRAALGDAGEITMTGMMSILGRTLYAAINSMAKSYLVAFAVVTLMMILLIGNLRLGLAAMVPNLTPIIMTLGFMGWMGIPLDLFTMLIGSIAIGLAVDDTIHFMHNFRRYHGETGDVVEAVRRTLHTAGRAMVVTTVVLSTGFFIYMMADMINIIRFGLLTGVTIALALVALFLMGPALMVLTHPRPGGERAQQEEPGS